MPQGGARLSEVGTLGRDGSPSRPFADGDSHVDPVNVLGRDGSPSRPFADGVAKLFRLNGGLGEPALPKAGDH